MIFFQDIYECPKCNEWFFFETTKKPYNTKCPNCNSEMFFVDCVDCDTELEEKPPYAPTKDPKSPYYIPVVECPYCHSTNTTKISTGDRYIGTVNFAAFSKQWHCNSCDSDF